jgi:hypothetical protein
MVACKKCSGIFPIIEGDASLIDDGKAVAYNGCLVKCGARLVGGQIFTTTQPSAGAAPSAAAGSDGGFNAIGAVAEGKAASYEEAPVDDEKKRYRGRFRIVDDSTGAAIVGEAVAVTTNGGHVSGATDADGYTAWVDRDANEALSLELNATRRP